MFSLRGRSETCLDLCFSPEMCEDIVCERVSVVIRILDNRCCRFGCLSIMS